MRWGKLSLILVLTGGIVGFNFAFKNLLVKQLMESALQSIFQAKAEVRGVQFQFFKGRLKFDQMIVANKDKPMYNLFELGFTEFDMHTGELLKAKVVIENMECRGIQWDTARETSGALPHLKEKSQEEAASEEEPGILEMAKINAEELLEKHKAELKSLDFLSNANQELEAFNQKWSNKVATARNNVNDLEASYNKVKAIDVSAIKTLPQATVALKDINDFQKSLSAVSKDVKGLKSSVSADLKMVKATIKESKTVVASDMAYLKSLINIPEGGAKGIIKSMLNKVLAEKLGSIYYYAGEALKYTHAINDSTPKSKKEQKKMMKAASQRRPGFEVHFPTSGYPKFLLEHMGTSISNVAEAKYLVVDINDLSSDFNQWDKPLTYSIDRKNQGMGLNLEGSIDPRTNSNEAFAMDLSLSAIPFTILDDLSFINISSMKGKYTIDTSLILRKDASNEGEMKLVLRELEILKGNQTGTVSDILYDILTDSSTIDFFISYSIIQPEGRLQMKVSSSLDGVVQARVGKFVDNMVGEATGKLSTELNKLTGPLLEQTDVLGGESLGLEKILGESSTGLDSYQSGVDSKKSGVTARMGQLKTGGVTDKIPQNIKLPKF